MAAPTVSDAKVHSSVASTSREERAARETADFQAAAVTQHEAADAVDDVKALHALTKHCCQTHSVRARTGGTRALCGIPLCEESEDDNDVHNRPLCRAAYS